MEYPIPPKEILYPLYSVHKLRRPFSLIGKGLNLESLYNKNEVLYKIFSKERKFETNPRIAEIPLTLYYLGKYKISPPAKILDVGYLESLLPYFLSSIGFDCIGIDIREQKIIIKGAEIKTYQQDICKFSPEIKFDAVTCISTLEHIGLGYGDEMGNSKDKEALNKIYQLLKPLGLLFLSVPMSEKFRVIENFERHYSLKKFSDLITSSGFKILERKYIIKNCDFWKVSEDFPQLQKEDTFVGFFVLKKVEK
jgi:2-polyprenyl-3-methyl-5-hydroxy-6-metoxy-1,4-benzoquinol methylase